MSFRSNQPTNNSNKKLYVFSRVLHCAQMVALHFSRFWFSEHKICTYRLVPIRRSTHTHTKLKRINVQTEKTKRSALICYFIYSTNRTHIHSVNNSKAIILVMFLNWNLWFGESLGKLIRTIRFRHIFII